LGVYEAGVVGGDDHHRLERAPNGRRIAQRAAHRVDTSFLSRARRARTWARSTRHNRATSGSAPPDAADEMVAALLLRRGQVREIDLSGSGEGGLLVGEHARDDLVALEDLRPVLERVPRSGLVVLEVIRTL
jgi:hypothetical protein